MDSPTSHPEPSSFRDPSGFIFWRKAEPYRQINAPYLPTYNQLKQSGFLEKLMNEQLLIPHTEVKSTSETLTIKPEQISFISYPYEWCFSQLQDAALLTLRIQKRSLAANFTLKDASAYNIQFRQGRPIFIDTLSFAPYSEGEPWVAYRQFVQHFLAPLSLMAKVDINLGRLSELYLDGLPLELTSHLLPLSSLLSPALLFHLHLHARIQATHADRHESEVPKKRLSKMALLGIIDNLEKSVRNLKPKKQLTEWEHYYRFTNYSEQAERSKEQVITDFLKQTKPTRVLDLGANTGQYSRLASRQGIFTVASDVDPLAVEQCYRELRMSGEQSLLPLVIDLTNPSPAIGWQNRERPAFLDRISRGRFELTMALALIHHLAISNNLPFAQIATSFAQLSPRLIIEFVPKSDSQVQKLLSTREDIFPDYTQTGFEQAFSQFFSIQKQINLKDSQRTLYLMKRHS